MIIIYVLFVYVFTKKTPKFFLNGISPAQLLAFSTSSSAATLPVTMERVEEHLGVEEEVSSFVLPIGATINMDGTSLYQAVAAVDRKSTRLNSSHVRISYAVFCLKKKKKKNN